MEVTESGMVMLANELHSRKAYAWIALHSDESTTVVIDDFENSDMNRALGMAMLVNELHALKV